LVPSGDPSTLGIFLRAFSFGHVRQLEAVIGVALARAWVAGAGPGAAGVVIDVDSTVCEVAGKAKQGAAYGYTGVLGYHHYAEISIMGLCGIPHKRHHFAYANVERWMAQGTDITAMLPYLARYMGHATIESTYYYIHTSPDFMDSYADITSQTQSVLPEVGFE
jgi:hypothetical protein